MMLQEIRLVNFRGIADMTLPFTTTTTAILGVNGVGKSSVLDALAIALSNMTERIAGQAARARDISPDDIKTVIQPILAHRVLLTPEKEMEGIKPAMIIKQIVEGIEIPR